MNIRRKKIKVSDIFLHVVNLTYMPRWGVLLIDLFIVLIAYTLSYLIGSSLLEYHPEETLLPIWGGALFLMAVQSIFFVIFRTYSGILRFSTFVDTAKVSVAVFLAAILLLLVNVVLQLTASGQLLLNSVIVIYAFVATVLLFAWRVVIKLSFEYMSRHRGGTRNVMIYGVQSAALSIAKMLNSDMDSLYHPVGFIADPGENTHHLLQGMKVYTKNEHLIDILRAKEVEDVIVSPLKMRKINPATEMGLFLENDIRVLTTPNFTDFSAADGEDMSQRIGKIEAIKVEDLLERPSIQINTENVHGILDNKVVLITGAAGSIGSELVRQVANFEPSLIVLLDFAESPLHDLSIDLSKQFPKRSFSRIIADIRNRDMIREVFEEYKPSVVFHAAAYKHVPLMEEYPCQAVLANVMGTKNVADMAVEHGVERFVMISTDKAVNPTNVMGATKRTAEIYVQSLFRKLSAESESATRFITTRFGNVLGSNGSVVPYFKKQIASGGPVTVTHPDIIRYFMTIPEASCLVLEAATLGNGGEIFVFDMGRPVKIADLAKNMIRLAGFEPGKDIAIQYTGLRPGEKLYEELLNQKELTKPTPNEKIMIANVREADYDVVSKEVDELISLAQSGMVFPSVKKIKDIVPEFKSKNSPFEQLDN